jgi:ornithine cyclodeaminase/alanine dehydrogenase-like protein (mu-crystallin family)
MLFLSEQNVKDALSGGNAFKDAVDVIERVLEQQSAGTTYHLKRYTMTHPNHPGHLWHNIRMLPAMVPELGAAAVRVYSGYRGTNRSEIICLFDWQDMRMSAIISDFFLHAIRTSAPYGVAAKYLSRSDASTLGIIGSGRYVATRRMCKVFAMQCMARLASTWWPVLPDARRRATRISS